MRRLRHCLFQAVFFALLHLVALVPAAHAQTADYIVGRAWVDDPDGTLELNRVQQLPALPYEGVLARGYTHSVTWLKLKVAAAPDAGPDHRLMLRIRPSYLDQVSLFDPFDDSGRMRLTGDHTDWQKSELKSLNHGFLIPASDQPREIWLRLKTSSSSLIHVDAMTLDEAQYADRMQEMWYGLMMGVLVLFFLWALLQWMLQREPLMLAFLLSQLVAVVYAASYVGYTRLFSAGVLPTMFIERFNNVIFCLYVATGMLFHYRFLSEYQASRIGLRVMAVIGSVAFLCEMAMLAAGYVMPAMRLNISIVSLLPILTLALAFSCRAWKLVDEDARPALPKWTLISFYCLLGSMLFLGAMPSHGLAEAPELNLHMYLIHGLMTGVILLVLLQVRAIRVEDSRNRAHLRAHSAAQQVEVEKQKMQLQGRFMEMLAHELKTSLSVLHMVFGAPKPNPDMLEHGRRTVNNINQLIERCLQAEKFDDDEIISHLERFGVDALLDDVISKTPDAVRIVVHKTPGMSVHSDWQIFKSVVSNLIDNALKYSAPGSMVQVHARQSERDGKPGCEICVENEVAQGAGSAGLPDREQLFKKYYRADSARKHSGSGLGLYLVANFMRLLGGEVRYEPLENRVRFSVWLPN
jgi:signal transduction histidine kinase